MEETSNTPQFGFAIDHRKCIGCHACTVACKAENEVPLGKFRTWVKYTEKGSFPDVRRHFTVLRCNHCDDAPCVEICPVVALSKRPDAIVDLDRDACIGCRACMQACPYDALYLNEDSGTAEKCHYCAHRTERGLEPACVVVCPEQAIVSGDVSNPDSEIATLIRDEKTSQRKLEKGTKPRVWYVDALPESLTPGAATEPESYLWSQRSDQPPQIPQGFEPPEDVLTSLNVAHPPVWGWHIWTYLVTKNLAVGAMLVAPLLLWLGVPESADVQQVPELVALVFLGLTLFLLVHDLGRPERFLKMLTRPNTKSWLVRGSWVLMAFGGVTFASLAMHWIGSYGLRDILRYVNLPGAVLASGYTAWLFAQCRGRDLWIEGGLFAKLVTRAALLGIPVAMAVSQDADRATILAAVYAVLLGLLLYLEHRKMDRTTDGAKAHAIMMEDPDVRRGTLALLCAGMLLMCGGALGPPAVAPLAIGALVLTIVGQFMQERAWVRAGQAVPLS